MSNSATLESPSMAQTSCRSRLLECQASQLRAVHRHAPAPFRSANLRPSRPNSFVLHASDSNGVPSLDDSEAAPIPLVPAPAVPSASNAGPLLAVGAVALGAAVFLATRLTGGAVSFDTLTSDAVPLSAALQSNRPTVVEFYASWYLPRRLSPQRPLHAILTTCLVTGSHSTQMLLRTLCVIR